MTHTPAVVYVVDDDSPRAKVAGLIRSAGLTAKTFTSAEEFLAAPRPRCPLLGAGRGLPGQADSICSKSWPSRMLRSRSYSSPVRRYSHDGARPQGRSRDLFDETFRRRRAAERHPAVSYFRRRRTAVPPIGDTLRAPLQ